MQHRNRFTQKGGVRKSGGPQEIDPRLKPPEKRIEYFSGRDDRGKPIVRPELLDKEAEEKARAFSDLKPTQLRRFYGVITALKREIVETNLEDEGVRARLALLKAHAAYASGQKKKVPDAFLKFIVANVASVKTRDDFLFGFAPHFEAVVAYHRIYAKDN